MFLSGRWVAGDTAISHPSSVWDPGRQRPLFARQAAFGVLPIHHLSHDLRLSPHDWALNGWVMLELWFGLPSNLDFRDYGPALTSRACGQEGAGYGPTIGEMVVAVAAQRACAPGAKCHLAGFSGIVFASSHRACRRIGVHRTGVSSV